MKTKKVQPVGILRAQGKDYYLIGSLGNHSNFSVVDPYKFTPLNPNQIVSKAIFEPEFPVCICGDYVIEYQKLKEIDVKDE